MNRIRKVSIIGMGALGLLYADQITSGLNDMNAVEFVMDRDRAMHHANDIYKINGEIRNFKITDAAKAEKADLVMVAVKYTALPDALDTMKNAIGEDTIIMSVMNGVTSEKIIAERYGWKHMIHTVAQGMDAMRHGSSLKYTQCGKLYIGSIDPTNPAISGEAEPAITAEKMADNLVAVKELFECASLPHVVEEDIMHRMWFKFMLNVGTNQTCMVYDTTYGVATTPGTEIYRNYLEAMYEVIPAAKANGLTLTEEDALTCIKIERTLDPDGYPSMAQDRKAGRKSEVEMFAGEVLRMAEKYGFEAPVNRYYYDRIMEIEAGYRE